MFQSIIFARLNDWTTVHPNLYTKFHKLSFWVPILAAESPYFTKSWVSTKFLFLRLEVRKSLSEQCIPALWPLRKRTFWDIPESRILISLKSPKDPFYFYPSKGHEGQERVDIAPPPLMLRSLKMIPAPADSSLGAFFNASSKTHFGIASGSTLGSDTWIFILGLLWRVTNTPQRFFFLDPHDITRFFFCDLIR